MARLTSNMISSADPVSRVVVTPASNACRKLAASSKPIIYDFSSGNGAQFRAHAVALAMQHGLLSEDPASKREC